MKIANMIEKFIIVIKSLSNGATKLTYTIGEGMLCGIFP